MNDFIYLFTLLFSTRIIGVLFTGTLVLADRDRQETTGFAWWREILDLSIYSVNY